jgi:sarcosine oxidase delta subunit
MDRRRGEESMRRTAFLAGFLIIVMAAIEVTSSRPASADQEVWQEYVYGNHPGEVAEVGVWTHPHARYSIRYVTASRIVSTARGLHTKTADDDGWPVLIFHSLSGRTAKPIRVSA